VSSVEAMIKFALRDISNAITSGTFVINAVVIDYFSISATLETLFPAIIIVRAAGEYSTGTFNENKKAKCNN